MIIIVQIPKWHNPHEILHEGYATLHFQKKLSKGQENDIPLKCNARFVGYPTIGLTPSTDLKDTRPAMH